MVRWVISRFCPLTLGGIVWLLSGVLALQASPFISDNQPEKLHMEQLDLEILLLKMQLVLTKKELGEAKQYQNRLIAIWQSLPLDRLEEGPKWQVLQQQFNALQQQLAQLQQEEALLKRAEGFAVNTETILVFLPMTGPYASAGQALLQGIEDSLPLEQSVKVFDTELYDSMVSLWELAQLFEPTLILGPLRKEQLQQWIQLQVPIPTLAFNRVPEIVSTPYVKSLAPNRTDDITYLVQWLQQYHYQHIALLYEDSVKGQALKQKFDQAWLDLSKTHTSVEVGRIDDAKIIGNAPRITAIEVSDRLDGALAKLLHIPASNERAGWLQRTLKTPLHHLPRGRRDFDVVVSFLPYESASQVTPLLQFYHLDQVLSVWLPTEVPLVEKFVSNLAFWQATLAVLPNYFALQVQRFKQSHRSSQVEKTDFSKESVDVGIFYALGELAVLVMARMDALAVQPVQTSLGRVIYQQSHFHLWPTLYWLEEGALQPLP